MSKPIGNPQDGWSKINKVWHLYVLGVRMARIEVLNPTLMTNYEIFFYCATDSNGSTYFNNTTKWVSYGSTTSLKAAMDQAEKDAINILDTLKNRINSKTNFVDPFKKPDPPPPVAPEEKKDDKDDKDKLPN